VDALKRELALAVVRPAGGLLRESALLCVSARALMSEFRLLMARSEEMIERGRLRRVPPGAVPAAEG